MLDDLESIREKFEESVRNTLPSETHIVLLAVIAVAVVAIGVFVFVRSQPRQVAYNTGATLERERQVKTRARPTARPKIKIHVAGKVNRPQVYELPGGSRVFDAVKAAGGALPEADLDVLNLAAKLNDGERVYIPAKGEAPPAGVGDATIDGKIDLNTASAADLETLDGIGPKLAERIIKYRTKIRSFKSVEQLDEVEGVGPKKLELIKDQVVTR